MTIPSVEEMKEHNKQAQAAQDLALMVEQVMLRSPEFSEEVAIARAKVILAAKAHVLAQPAALYGLATRPATLAPIPPLRLVCGRLWRHKRQLRSSYANN